MATGIAVFATRIGSCGIAWTDHGICGVQLPEGSHDATSARLSRVHPAATAMTPPAAVTAAIGRINGLLAGDPDDLRDLIVDVEGASVFNRQVWDATREVGPGETTTYGAIAVAIGSPHAAQQVGQALGANPVPLIVPCHRVLGAGGKLVGFSAAGGVETKLRLLDIEGAEPNGQPALF